MQKRRQYLQVDRYAKNDKGARWPWFHYLSNRRIVKP